MQRRDISAQEMATRVAHFDELKPSTHAFVDTILPDHEREYFNIIGRGVTEDANLRPAITDVKGGFNVSYVRSLPGKRSALHDHDTVEVFICIEGTYQVLWGEQGEHELTLRPRDVISVPPGVMRCFRNSGEVQGLLLVIFGGSDAGRVHWESRVISEAQKVGWSLTPSGDLVRPK
jgi:mannose-6-phosphate isomerase-like protein (cupin superfamily)